jgi:hypothetical protein
MADVYCDFLSPICTLPSWQMADVYCDFLSPICTLPSWQMEKF